MKSRSSLVLIVDDDDAIREGLSQELEDEGYCTLEARNGQEALALLSRAPDLIVTDLAMPELDGFRLIERVRERSRIPIIVLSVHGGESDKVRALDSGANDYIVKPPPIGELLARVRAQLRSVGAPTLLRFPGLTIDLETRRVAQGGKEVKLTPTEFALLALFASEAGKPLSFGHIMDRVWGSDKSVTRDAVRVQVSSLRRKIEPDPASPQYLVTEPWLGYRFIGEAL